MPTHNPPLHPAQAPEMGLVRYIVPGTIGTLPTHQNPERENGGLFEYWHNLRRHRVTWFVFAFLGALTGFLIAVPQTPMYEAHTSLEIVGMNENFMNFG